MLERKPYQTRSLVKAMCIVYLSCPSHDKKNRGLESDFSSKIKKSRQVFRMLTNLWKFLHVTRFLKFCLFKRNVLYAHYYMKKKTLGKLLSHSPTCSRFFGKYRVLMMQSLIKFFFKYRIWLMQFSIRNWNRKSRARLMNSLIKSWS